MNKSSEHLTIYLERIHAFLTSNDNSIIFPSVTMSIEDILVNIAKETNFLKQSLFGDDCKSIAAKLSTVLDKNKDVFTLDYEFKFDDKRKKVMVYKKIPVCAFQEPVRVPSKPFRKPNVIKEKTENKTPKSVMSCFKITFLNSTLKFVKDDSQLILSYPNMSTEQADFVKQMIDQCMESHGTKTGFKGLYDPLSEALKIFSLKYDFKLYVGTKDDMKKLTFVKTRKNTDTIKKEGTSVIYEETTDSDSSLEQSRRRKPQKKLTTLIACHVNTLTQITPAFKRRTLTDLKDFLKDNSISFHTFSNLSLHEQQFISQWQALTQRVEVMKMLDVQSLMVLDEIRGYLKRKNFRVKVELGLTSSQNRFAKLTKVFNPNIVKLSEEEKVARLEAMVLPSKTGLAARAAGISSSGTSSSDSNSKPRTKFERKVKKFFRKTKGVKNDWIQATLAQLRNFLQDETEASLIIRSLTELQTAFLAKWQNLLSEPEVIKSYSSDVQVLMHDVRDAARANKNKFRVEYSLTKSRTGLRDAKFAKLPVFNTSPNKIPKENVPVNILPKNNGNKTENGLDDANVNKTSEENVLVNIPYTNKENMIENNLAVLMEDMSIRNESGNLGITNPKKIYPKNGDKTEIRSEKAAVATDKKLAAKFESCDGGNNGVAAKATAPKTSKLPAPVKLEPKNEGNNKKSSEKAAVPTDKKLAAKFESCDGGNNGVAAKATAPKTSNLAAPVKLEPKNEGNNKKSSEKAAVPQTTKIPHPQNYEAKEISKKVEIFVETAKAAPKKKNFAAPVKFEPKLSDDKSAKTPENAMKRDAYELQSGSVANLYRTVCKKLKAAEDQGKEVTPKAIHRSTSLTSLDQKDRRAKNAGKVVKLPAATVKLIEGLNQPLVSERGLKMMRQMGWEGGPLGVRGEGIAEPIMPEIELGKRAGLGAPKPNIQVLVAASKALQGSGDDDLREGIVNSADNDLKNDVMQMLLRMVKGEKPQRTEMKFDHKLTMPDWNYIMVVATSFNNREIFPEGMSAVLQRVTDNELMLTAAWSCSKTEILLTLSKYKEEIKANRDKWGHVALVPETLSKKNLRKLLEASAAGDIDTRVMVTGKAFKHYVMAKILDFCLNCNAKSPTIKEVTKDIILKGTMVKKQLSYIRDVVNRLNASAPCSSNSVQDIAIHDEIISTMHGKGYKVSVDFPSLQEKDGNPIHSIISLTKTYGYRVKTVLIKKPAVKTKITTTNNNCSTKENKNLLTTQYTENKEKNIQIAKNNIKVKNPVVSKGNVKSNVMDVDETITNNNINDIIATMTEINIAKNTDIKDVATTSSIEISNGNNEKRFSKRSIALSSDTAHKRTKYDCVKQINIVPKDYPQTKMTKKMAAQIQKSIQKTIDHNQVLPLLKCHGIQDGVLSYSCHNEKSLEIIQNVVKPFNLIVSLTEESEKGTCRMSLKLNTFVDESVESIFKNLETFNLGLITKDWVFIKKEQYSDFIVIFVDIDLDSYKFIRGENFKLYVGIDEARFSIVWG